jgi:hypothetical protein
MNTSTGYRLTPADSQAVRTVVRTVADSYRIHPDAVTRPASPKRSRKARIIVAHILRRVSPTILADILHTTPQDIAAMRGHAESLLREDRDFAARHDTLRRIIRNRLR